MTLRDAPEAARCAYWGVLRTSTAAKAVAFVASGAVHAAALAVAAPGAGREGGVDFEIPILVENIEPSPAPATAPMPEPPRMAVPGAPARARSSARVEPTRAASEAHAAAAVENVVAEAPPVIVRSPVEQPPRFVMVVGGAGRTGGVGATPEDGVSANRADPIFPVEEVTTPARLLAGSPPHYPMKGRANGVEADVRLELVVNSAGRVQSTRVLGTPSPEFDAAALDAVAGYRFTPAMLNGRPVKVRMKWSVEFRLN